MRLSANLAFLYPDLPWPQRPVAARAAGFDEVEFPWPDDAEALAAAVRAAGVGVALLNMPAGDLAAGDRGFGHDPRRRRWWREHLVLALRLAERVGCRTVNVLAGNRCAEVPVETQRRCLADNLAWAAERADGYGVRLVVEPVNRRDTPGYLLPRARDVHALVEELAGADVGIQLDTYHCVQEGDDPVALAAALGGRIGHVQLADHPGRHEPGSAGLDFPALLAALAGAGYRGALGLEYLPTRRPDRDSLAAVLCP
jgi:hydroxypyruvate isomerase